MQLRFTKYHGLGNDFVIINNLDDSISLNKEQILSICDRHFGIGADGLILSRPSDVADFYMDFYNSDGSIAEMCGNGIRCYAKFLHDEKLVDKEVVDIETRAGILSIELIFLDKTVAAAKVDMGEPILEASNIPVENGFGTGTKFEPGSDNNSESVASAQAAGHVIDEMFEIEDSSFRATCVSMGNPHFVTFVDDTSSAPVRKFGPKIEASGYFPQKTNVEFAHIMSRNEIDLRVWERGCGETLACGTGACATLVAAVLNDKTDRKAVVHLPGGDLRIKWADNNHLIMEGPAERVFTGEIVL